MENFTLWPKNNPRKKHEWWTNNSQQHCVIQIVIEKLAVHSKSQKRAKKSLIFGRGKTSMIHESAMQSFHNVQLGDCFGVFLKYIYANFSSRDFLEKKFILQKKYLVYTQVC